MELKQLEKISKALSDVNRLKILQHMHAHQGHMECMEIGAILQLAQPSISHHIKKLLEADLIEARKTGRYHHYALNTRVWEDYLGTLKDFRGS
jgi:ArsR family transcriptional regulator